MGWVRAGMATVLAVCVTSACGGGSETSSALADGERPTSFEDVEFDSPIASFLGYDTSSFGAGDTAEFAAQQIAAEEATAACMREQGFTYLPVDQSQFTSFSGGDDTDYFSDEWIAKYGFGITTQRFSQSEIGPDLVGYEDMMAESETEFVDPNQDYVEGLSDSERDAYFLALYGDEPEVPENATEEEMNAIFSDFQPTGCQAEAQETAFGNGAMGFYDEFGDELMAMEERVNADQRVVAYQQQVTECVAEQGLVFTTMDDLYQEFESKMESIGPDYSKDPLEASGKDPSTMTEEEINEIYQNYNVLDDEDRAALGELQRGEVELAQAVTECGGGWLNELVVLGEIRAEYEQEFLDANRDLVAEFEDSAN